MAQNAPSRKGGRSISPAPFKSSPYMAPLCKGSWLRRQPETEGLLTTPPPRFARHLPLHRGGILTHSAVTVAARAIISSGVKKSSTETS